jgi:hypothetical protein
VVAPADAVGGQYCENCHAGHLVEDNATINPVSEGVPAYALDAANAEALWKKAKNSWANPSNLGALENEHFSWVSLWLGRMLRTLAAAWLGEVGKSVNYLALHTMSVSRPVWVGHSGSALRPIGRSSDYIGQPLVSPWPSR